MKRALVVLRGWRVVSLACGVLLALAAQSSEALAASWGPGVEASLPANAGSDPHVFLYSASCASAGNCGAVGGYNDGAGNVHGLLLTETAGTWAAGLEASLPANAGSNPDISLSVSCASAGNCSVVGSYADTSGHYQGLLLTETAGTWTAGVEASLPANAGADPLVSISSVSCASAGNCSAVGEYTDSSSHKQGLLLTETAGTWVTGVEASLPANAASSPAVVLRAVSCASAGNCSAVGHYRDSSGHTQGLLLTETAGTWLAVEAMLPAGASSGPGVSLNSVSCASAGSCSAVGTYFDLSGHTQGLLLTESAGTWAMGVEATPPAGAGTDPKVFLDPVSCGSVGNCSAVGNYADSSSHNEGLLLTETAGTWATGVEASLPAGAGTDPNVFLASVSCGSAGNCSAVGNYHESSGHRQALLLTETAGTWATGVAASAPANAASDPGAHLDSVSCASPGDCTAVGAYDDSSGHRQGLLLSTLRRLTVLKAGSGHGSVRSSPAGINCGASCSHSFVSGRSVTLTARPVGGSGFAGWSGACSGRGGCRVKMIAERTVTARFELLPDTKITKSKIDKTNRRAKFKFKARGKSTGFQCALVKKHKKGGKHKKPKPHFSSCRSPKTFKGLAAGGYTFLVRAFNAGGPDPTPAKKSFKL